MKSLTAMESDNLFPARRDAVLYLIGLGGFWGGVAVILIAADAALPSGIRLAVSPEQTSGMRRAARAIAGYDGGALPDTYGMTAAALAALMNDWRERYATLT